MNTLSTAAIKPYQRRAHPGNSIWVQGHLMSFLATAEETGGQFALIETQLSPGDEPPLHTHAVDDEGFYILEGAVAFRIGDETAVARAGEFVLMPKAIEHTFRVVGGAARALLLSAPAGLETAFRTLGVPASQMSLRHDSPPVDKELYMRAFGEQGIIFHSSAEPRKAASPNPKLVRHPAVGVSRSYFGNLFTVLADGNATENRFAMVDMMMRRNEGPPSHVHTREDEAFYLLDGQAVIHCGNDVFELRAGDFAFLPRGIPHRPQVISETARALLFITPAGFENYFVENSAPVPSLQQPSLAPVETSRPEAMTFAARKYGFRLCA